MKVEEINHIREHDLLNTDAITTVSDQVANLMEEIAMLKKQK